jgi:CelD/BcsL family acetyltransferase involved in cellulose biosynthesis
MMRIRPLWEDLCAEGRYTVFQNFELNLLAAEQFAEREEPCVICAESESGAAIVPAALRHSDGSIRLLGEELFDYRTFLHGGDDEVLCAALAALAQLGRPLEITALREFEAVALRDKSPLLPFCCAPCVLHRDITADEFVVEHSRLARNLRRLAALGYRLRSYRGDYAGLVKFIYEKKAAQNSISLFHDPARIEFIVNAAALLPDRFEIFTLEDEASIAAALVVLREESCRRFYTGWFAPELEKHSPGLVLIYEITRQSLAEGLNCDYMTGEQPYKLRLATSSVPLHRLQATSEQLAAIGQKSMQELIQAA